MNEQTLMPLSPELSVPEPQPDILEEQASAVFAPRLPHHPQAAEDISPVVIEAPDSGVSEPPELNELPEPPAVLSVPEEPQKETPPVQTELPSAEVQNSSGAYPRDMEAARHRYWQRILTGNPDSVPADVRKRSGVDEVSQSPSEGRYMLCSILNRSWYADHRGETDMQSWPQQRAELARELGVADDEEELYVAISQEQREAPIRAAAENIHRRAYADGLRGYGEPSAAEHMKGIPQQYAEPMDEVLVAAYEQGRQDRNKWYNLASRVAEGVGVILSQESNPVAATQSLVHLPELLSAVDELADLPEKDKQLVMYLALEESKKSAHEPAGVGQTALRGVRRGASNLRFDMAQLIGNATAATLQQAGKWFGEPENGSLSSMGNSVDRRMRTLRELQLFAQESVSPLDLAPDAPAAGKYAVDAAGSIPMAVLSCCGGAGFALMLSSASGQSIANARMRAPEVDLRRQVGAGISSGVAQAAIFCAINRMGGRMLENSINSFLRAKGRGWTGYSLAALQTTGSAAAEGGKIMLASKFGQVIDMTAHEEAARKSGKDSHIDWKEFLKQQTDADRNLSEAAATLPFVLIGAGKVALHHFREPQSLLGDGSQLVRWGIPKESVTEILNEPDLHRQSVILRSCVQKSPLWNDPDFPKLAQESLKLLHGKDFQEFNDLNSVRDFLELPPVKDSLTPGDKIPTPLHKEFALYADRWHEALALFNSWYSRATHHMRPDALISGRFRRIGKFRENKSDRLQQYVRFLKNPSFWLTGGLNQSGVFRAGDREAREMLFRDRVQDVHSLAHQFVMNLYPVDRMANGPEPLEVYQKEAEHFLNRVYSELATSVLLRALGDGEDAAKNLDLFMLESLMEHKFGGDPPGWLEKTLHRDLDSAFSHLEEGDSSFWQASPHFSQSFRVLMGLRANASMLYELIPVTDDFSAALSRGFSPLQAMEHILRREFEYDPKDTTYYPRSVLDNSQKVDIAAWAEDNQRLFNFYSELTGVSLENQLGEDAQNYWRILRPDGYYTRWHRTREQAVNDLVAHSGALFLPYGESTASLLESAFRSQQYHPQLYPRSAPGEFNAFDHLSNIATRDLLEYWFGSAGYAPPALRIVNKGRILGTNERKNMDFTVPRIHLPNPTVKEQSLKLDRLNLLTPFSVAQGRFRAFWRLMFTSGRLDLFSGRELLQRLGKITDDEIAAIDEDLRKRDMRKKPRKRGDDGELRYVIQRGFATKRAEELIIERLSEFTDCFYLAHLEDQNLPASVRRWYATLPFCSPLQVELPSRISYRRAGQGVVNHANSLQMEKILGMMPEIKAIRTQYTPQGTGDAEFDHLLQWAIGNNEGMQVEQGWCVYHRDPAVLAAIPQTGWNILDLPFSNWKYLTPQEQERFRYKLNPFCRQEPLPLTQEMEARGESPDALLDHLRNLEETLADYPELRHYAPNPDAIGGYRMLTQSQEQPLFTDYAGDMLLSLAHLDEYQYPLPQKDALKVEPVTEVPDYFLEDYRVVPALRFLHTLRSVVVNRPYPLPHGVWWNGDLYGGVHGKAVPGLEGWKCEPVLSHVRRLLSDVYTYNQAHEDEPLSICGIRLDGLSPEESRLPELDGSYVYFGGEGNKAWHICRFLPGDFFSENPLTRGPHLIYSNGGRYYIDRRPIWNVEEYPMAYQPLETFTPASVQGQFSTAESEDKGMRLSVNYVLEQLRDYEPAPTGGPAVGSFSLPELLMRLMEDTGFSQSLRNVKNVYSLTHPQATMLRLATSIIRSFTDPESAGNLAQMKRLATELLNPEDEFRAERFWLMMMDYMQSTTDGIRQSKAAARAEKKKPRPRTKPVPDAPYTPPKLIPKKHVKRPRHE